MQRRAVLVGTCLFSFVAVGAAGFIRLQSSPTATGALLRPTGSQTNVGSFPINMVLSPDGRFIVVSDVGFHQQLSVLDAATGNLVSSLEFNRREGNLKQALYFGLTFEPDGTLYVSRGEQDRVSRFTLSSEGTLIPKDADLNLSSGVRDQPNFIAGLGSSTDGKTLFAVNNETYFEVNAGRIVEKPGSVSLVDPNSGVVSSTIPCGGMPYDVVASDSNIYVTSERDGCVYIVSRKSGNSTALQTGANPTNMYLDRMRSKLYVSNSGSDTVSVIDTKTNTLARTLLVRPAEARGFPGATPLGLYASPDGKSLYVACADLNAVAVLDLSSGKLKGYIPVGWYPTSVLIAANNLFVANAKGVVARTPNRRPAAEYSPVIESLLQGTVSCISITDATRELNALTRVAIHSNGLDRPANTLKNPGIHHVIYIIKENRTYDSFFGDMKPGNGDETLCMFPEIVTPNQHALANRFGVLDNFYVCAEVSADGWNWSTAGIASPYVQRNTVVKYGGRVRSYDFEGDTNDVAVERFNIPDVAAPASGYLWDASFNSRVTFRNYGAFVDTEGEDGDREDVPNKKALQGHTDTNFRQFDMAYADSNAWVQLGKHAPKQMLAFGKKRSPSRFAEWKSEFEEFVRNGNLPALSLMRLPRDHTQGTAAGFSSPRAMVADNDYALGQIVETVSHTPYWKDTMICVLEDDAQNGRDHVDAHRSTALLISAFTKGGVNSHFWNTDSMLKTIEVLLRIKPMNHYDAFAEPIDVFSAGSENSAPYSAIMPSAEILNGINSPAAYRAKDSERLLDRFAEHDSSDLELNDILWGDMKRASR